MENQEDNLNKRNIPLWNKLVEEVFEHSASRFNLFIYELIKRRVLGKKGKEFRATATLEKKYKIKNIK